MSDMFGWAGTILKVDLTSKEILRMPTAEMCPEKFIGGVGFCNRLYWDMGCPEVEGFDPGNPFMISVGPLTGLPGPFNRAEICGIGVQNHPRPQFTYSGFGGRFPSAMKYAGYDVIVITGRSERPVCLDIRDHDVAIRDAEDLWGLDIFETQRVMGASRPDTSILTIGPAGENLSRIAIAATETGSSAGQGGFGAVMGSKNLKAIAVRGTGVVKVARPDELISLIAECRERGSWARGSVQSWGRAPLCGGDVSRELISKHRKKFAGPYGCPYQCLGFYDVPGVGQGANMCASWWYGFFRRDRNAVRAVWKGNLLAQKLGLNHFELGSLMAIVADTLEQGLMTEKDWEEAGLPPLPGWLGGSNPDEAFLDALISDMAGGSSFSQGVVRAMHQVMEKIGNPDAVKRLVDIEYPAWGYPKHHYGLIGLCLHVALDTRDSGNSADGYMSFNQNIGNIPEEALGKHFGVPHGPSTYAHAPGGDEQAVWEGIEHQTRWETTQQCLKNSLPICDFAGLPDTHFHPPDMDIRKFQARAFSAVTGTETDAEALWQAGERIWNLRRAVMIRQEARTREKDTYADGFFDTEWIEHIDAAGEDDYHLFRTYVDRQKFEALKERYYKLAGWDVKTGWPTRQKLEELGMRDVADGLAAARKILS